MKFRSSPTQFVELRKGPFNATTGIVMGLPMPPSINAQYSAFRGRVTKSPTARAYDAIADEFILNQFHKLKEIGNYFSALLSNKMLVVVDCYFVFHKGRFFTKTKGADPIKTLDANNRMKTAIDYLCKGIGIDDKYIVGGVCEKIVCESEENEQVIFIIRQGSINTLQGLSFELNLPVTIEGEKNERK